MEYWEMLMIPVVMLVFVAVVTAFVRLVNLPVELAENQEYCPEGYTAGPSKPRDFPPQFIAEEGGFPMVVECTRITTEENHYSKDVIVVSKQ